MYKSYALLFLILAVAMISISCSKPVSKKVTTDFRPIKISRSAFTNSSYFDKSKLTECREHINEILCLVDPLDNENPYADLYNRPCLEGADKFSNIFLEHFDHSPELIQRMYCSLEKIWIENSLSTTAYASPISDMSNNLVAGAIGIKREFLENPESIDTWFSKKEESSFGANGIINYQTTQSQNKFSAIHFAINHEFGHLLDYANKINRYNEDCRLESDPTNCIPAENSWGEISWINAKKSKEYFSLMDELCFYSCHDQFIDASKANLLFESLIQTNFQSTYSTVNPKEDWAEAFALYLAVESENFHWKVGTSDKTFDLKNHFQSVKLKAKRDFVKKFIESDFKYPDGN